MNASIWQAVKELATVWRSSPFVQDYAARVGIAESPRSTRHIAAQPFYLPIYLPTSNDYELVTRSANGRAWLKNGDLLGHAYTTLIEWLRSRLNGYPFPAAPQLSPVSPWTSFNVSMRVPWLLEFRQQQLQLRTTPPTIPFLEVPPEKQLDAGAQLGRSIASSSAAAHLQAAQRELTDVDRQQLHSASVALSQSHYPEPDDVTGSEDFRELAWYEYELDRVLHTLGDAARTFADALTAADLLLQQTAALFSHLTVYDTIRQIDEITLVEQLDGATGWHSVRTNALLQSQVRQSEILGFDHPYPRGVMLVAGVTERFNRYGATTTVHGQILPDSTELAASAVPIRPVDKIYTTSSNLRTRPATSTADGEA